MGREINPESPAFRVAQDGITEEVHMEELCGVTPSGWQMYILMSNKKSRYIVSINNLFL